MASDQDGQGGYGFEEGFDDLEEAREEGAWRFFHVPPTGSVSVLVLVPRPLRFSGHYFSRQMWRCPGPACGLCGDEVGKERKIASQRRYVLAVQIDEGRPALFEFGWQTAEDVAAILDSRGSLLGVLLDVARDPPGRRQPIRVVGQPGGASDGSEEVSGVADFAALLSRHIRIWEGRSR
jgi:hypothetical protein